MRRRNARGVSLLELLIAVVVMGVLATLAVLYFKGARDEAFDRDATAYLQLLRRACQTYYEEWGTYPPAIGQLSQIKIPANSPWVYGFAAAGGGTTWPFPNAVSTMDGREYRVREDGQID